MSIFLQHGVFPMKPATETQSLSAAAEVKRNWSIVQAIHISSPERETVII
jgi:hypothetical protein